MRPKWESTVRNSHDPNPTSVDIDFRKDSRNTPLQQPVTVEKRSQGKRVTLDPPPSRWERLRSGYG